jgi:hypothetical protein
MTMTRLELQRAPQAILSSELRSLDKMAFGRYLKLKKLN